MIDFASRTRPAPRGETVGASQPESCPDLSWDTEVFVLQAETREHLAQQALDLCAFLERAPQVVLKDLAATLATELHPTSSRLAVVAGSLADLQTRLRRAAERLGDPRCRFIKDSAGIYYFSEPLYRQGNLVLLFPGEGAQYLNMLADLLPHFPEVEECFAEADSGAIPITPTFLVPPNSTPEQKAEVEKQLRSLEYSISSVLLADLALHRILQGLEIPVSAVAGHSAGELAALSVSRSISGGGLVLDQVITTLAGLEAGTGEAEPDTMLLAVGAGRPVLQQIIQELAASERVFLAMDNCPHQCVVVGDMEPMKGVEAALQGRGIVCERLPFHRPYHTPLFEPFMEPLRRMFDGVRFHTPTTSLYCCTTGQQFPEDGEAIRQLTLAHWISPVEFTRLVQNLYADGARIFVEVGPRGNLTAFVEDILRGQSVAAVAANVTRKSGLTQLNHLAAQLLAHQVPLRLAYFYERRQPVEVDWRRLTATVPEVPAASPLRAQVMGNYLAVMDEFLQLQQTVMENYLATRRGVPAPPVGADLLVCQVEQPEPPAPFVEEIPPAPEAQALPPGSPAPWIMLGEIVQHDPGYELVTRRHLRLDEDLYARDHSLGGTGVSRVDPLQFGSPVLPMTFSLETMAEAAAVLLPHLTVIGLENVRLHRWIAFDDSAPTILEIRARVLPAGDNDAVATVSVSIADRGHSPENLQSGGLTVEANVLLAAAFPEPPPDDFTLANERPCRITPESLYRNMFHGELFHGIVATERLGDLSIEGKVQVLPRSGRFRSTDEPALISDPVLLDMGMHLLAGWHLEQPDQSGRILLPFKLDRIEFFGPTPEVGQTLVVRGRTEQETARHVRHCIEVLDVTGRLWVRMSGAWYWRFYLPFQGAIANAINFFGPKDEYFLSARWPEAQPQKGPTGVCCMFLEPPADLLQSLLQVSTARVTLTPTELRQYQQLTGPNSARIEWLFGRMAAKDAVRQLWFEMGGIRLLPADMDLELNAAGQPRAKPRDPACHDVYPPVQVACAGGKMAALSATTGRPGIALAVIPVDQPLPLDAFDAQELRFLEQFGDNRAESLTRFACAHRAVVQALAPDLPGAEVGLAVRGGDPATGLLLVALGPALAEAFPEFRLDLLQVQTARRNELVVATTLCQRAES